MALSATTVWEVQTGGSDTANSGAFDPGQLSGMAVDGAATSATGNSPVFTSASYNFVAGDVNAYIYIGAGTNWTPGWYKIASVAANAATLTATIGTAVTQSTLAPNTIAGCATVVSPTGATWSIDYSQQTAAEITYTDLASVGTGLLVSSVLNPFGVQQVGNSIVITGGTNFNTGRYVIASVSVGLVATVVGPTNITTGAGVTGTGGLGGVMATPGGPSSPHVGGNRIWIKSGTYSQTSATNNVASGNLTLKGSTSSLATTVTGYNSVRGDNGTKPLLQASGISTFTMISIGAFSRVENLSLDGASLTSSRGIGNNSACEIYRCKLANFTNNAVSSGMMELCEITGCSTQPAVGTSSSVIIARFCVSYSNSVSGFSASGSPAVYIGCVSVNNTGSGCGFESTNFTMVCIGCVAYGNAGRGFLLGSSGSLGYSLDNCIAVNNTGVGYDGASGTGKLRSCAAYNNTGGATANFANGSIINLITLTGDPFTNAAGSDFSLNNTAGAGALCRAAGIPSASGVFALPGISTPAYPDLGPAQTQTQTGVSGMLFIPNMDGV